MWLANIKRWRGYEADVFPHYVQEIHTLRHVVHTCSPEVVFVTAEQTARYVRLVNLHHEHRTVPDAIVLALEHVCGLFAEHGPLSAPHSTACFTALRALVECCCLLDLFAPQLRRVLCALQVFARTCSVHDLAVCLDLMRCAHESAGPVSCTKSWPDNYTALCRLGEIVFTRFRSKTSYLDFQTAMAAIAPLCMLPWSLSEALTTLATSVIWLECVCVGPRQHVDVAGVYVVLQSLPACVPSRHVAQITRAALRAVCRGKPWDLTVIDCWYLSLVLQFAAHRVPFSELMRRGTRGVFVAGVNAVIGMFTRDPASLGSEIVQLRVAYYTATLVEVLVREAAVQRTRRRLWVEVLMVVLRQVGARPAALGVATAYSIVVILVKAVQSARCMDVVGGVDVLAEVPEGLVRAFLEECVVVRGPPPVPWGESAVFLREVGAVRGWSVEEGPGWFVQGVQRLVERAPEIGALMFGG